MHDFCTSFVYILNILGEIISKRDVDVSTRGGVTRTGIGGRR